MVASSTAKPHPTNKQRRRAREEGSFTLSDVQCRGLCEADKAERANKRGERAGERGDRGGERAGRAGERAESSISQSFF